MLLEIERTIASMKERKGAFQLHFQLRRCFPAPDAKKESIGGP
jgi:hypothetical protein